MAVRTDPPYQHPRRSSRVVPFVAIVIAAILTFVGLLLIWAASTVPTTGPENTTTIPQNNPPR